MVEPSLLFVDGLPSVFEFKRLKMEVVEEMKGEMILLATTVY
jgi:hypothetical protein